MFIFFFLLFFNNFFIAVPAITFLKNKNVNTLKINNQFWYLKFFANQDFCTSNSRTIQVVIIDGEINQKNPREKENSSCCLNLVSGERGFDFLESQGDSQNISLWMMSKKLNRRNFLYFFHADITKDLILQIAPRAKITVIPVLNQEGGSSKSDFYQGLQKALKVNPDILHLGIQIMDFNPKLVLDKKILKILKKFKCVIASAGNYGYQNLKVGFPANCSFVISVGSFGQRGDQYKISDFCQTNGGIDFVMPGENLLSQVWIEELQDYIFIPVSGTSMAAALMTGYVARTLENNTFKLLSDLKKYLIQNSIILNDSWKSQVKYGFPISK